MKILTCRRNDLVSVGIIGAKRPNRASSKMVPLVQVEMGLLGEIICRVKARLIWKVGRKGLYRGLTKLKVYMRIKQ